MAEGKPVMTNSPNGKTLVAADTTATGGLTSPLVACDPKSMESNPSAESTAATAILVNEKEQKHFRDLPVDVLVRILREAAPEDVAAVYMAFPDLAFKISSDGAKIAYERLIFADLSLTLVRKMAALRETVSNLVPTSLELFVDAVKYPRARKDEGFGCCAGDEEVEPDVWDIAMMVLRNFRHLPNLKKVVVNLDPVRSRDNRNFHVEGNNGNLLSANKRFKFGGFFWRWLAGRQLEELLVNGLKEIHLGPLTDKPLPELKKLQLKTDTVASVLGYGNALELFTAFPNLESVVLDPPPIYPTVLYTLDEDHYTEEIRLKLQNLNQFNFRIPSWWMRAVGQGPHKEELILLPNLRSAKITSWFRPGMSATRVAFTSALPSELETLEVGELGEGCDITVSSVMMLIRTRFRQLRVLKLVNNVRRFRAKELETFLKHFPQLRAFAVVKTGSFARDEAIAGGVGDGPGVLSFPTSDEQSSYFRELHAVLQEVTDGAFEFLYLHGVAVPDDVFPMKNRARWLGNFGLS